MGPIYGGLTLYDVYHNKVIALIIRVKFYYLHSVMLGSYDATEGPLLFMVDPSGLSWVSCGDHYIGSNLSYRGTRGWQ